MGSCDLYPQSLRHNPNGRFVVVCGDGEYIIYTALAWRNRSFGSALEFVWSSDGEYVVRESTSRIKLFSKSFQEKKSIRPTFSEERIFGGTVFEMCSNDFICFYDWAECRLICRIDVNVKHLYWADSGDLVAIASDTSFYILKYNRDIVSSFLDSGIPADEQGVEDAFELLHETNERVRTGLWVGDCFIYNNSSWRLNYCVGGEVTTMFHLDRPMYLLGYLAGQSRVYLIDKEFNVIGYTILLSLIEYKTLVKTSIILDRRGFPKMDGLPFKNGLCSACMVSASQKFLPFRNGLCGDGIKDSFFFLNNSDGAAFSRCSALRQQVCIMGEVKCNGISVQILINSDGSDSVVWSWVSVTQTTVNIAGLSWAEAVFEFWAVNRPICSSIPVCFFIILDHMGQLGSAYRMRCTWSGFLVLYSSLGDAEGIKKLAYLAKEQGKNNVAFLCLFMLVSDIVAIWKKEFDDWQASLAVESATIEQRGIYPPALEYLRYANKSKLNLVEAFKSLPVDEEEGSPLENGESNHEAMEVGNEEDGVDEAIEVDVDSTDGAVLVNGNEDDEEWGTNNEGTPPA
ncbi:hypothetical protein GIB67_027192 [Kingdonia uniflora]|uniref:Coatomer beta' subunit n=1 Tax=Kingdonia uniflora TaxID=39325 RepID=A0A7J7LBH4_9MAGN|nr:hypothetical protein GIB67_027192 [Kingdonia uniflora]